MDDRKVGPLGALRELESAGNIRIVRSGGRWIAWAEPSVHISGVGDSPTAAMKALVQRLRYVRVHDA